MLNELRDTALRAAASMPMNTYVGWDHGSTGVGVYQVHRGLLADPQVRRFFERFGVL